MHKTFPNEDRNFHKIKFVFHRLLFPINLKFVKTIEKMLRRILGQFSLQDISIDSSSKPSKSRLRLLQNKTGHKVPRLKIQIPKMQ